MSIVGIWKWLTASDAGFVPRFTRNMLVSLTTLAIILGLNSRGWIAGIEDSAFDLTLRAKAIVANIRNVADGAPIVKDGDFGIYLVDIDQPSHMAWGEPIHTPRNHIVEALRRGVSLNPRAIVLDIALDQQGVSAADDAALVRFIDDYDTNCGAPCPPLFLVKSLRWKWHSDVPFWRPSRIDGLDNAVAASQHVNWASPYQEHTSDEIVRHWRLSQCYRQDDRQYRSLMSIQLAVCISRSSPPDQFTERLDVAQKQTDAICQGAFPDGLDDPVCIGQGGPIFLNNDIEFRRISYQINRRQLQTGTAITTPSLTYGQENGFSSPALMVVSAKNFVDENRKIGGQLIPQQVIVIGESHADSADIHMTPVGAMPGALVVANTIYTLWYVGETAPAPFWANLLVLMIGVFLTSVLFLYVDSFFVTIITSTLIFVIVMPISWSMLSKGVWLDFAIPLLLIQVTEYVVKLAGVEREDNKDRTKKI